MDQDRARADELDAWLAPFLAVMGRKTWRIWAPLYLRDLLGPGVGPVRRPPGAGRRRSGPVRGNNRPLPGAQVWLVGEWRSSGERKYSLSNLPPDTSRGALAGTIKARWVCEQAHQRLK